jgi:zona occludens toxin
MSINVYTGLMGSGKSYECVSTVIVDAVAAGRRVVTNVDGIDSDEVRMYAHEKKGIPFDKLGQVDHCKNEDVTKPDFLPHGTEVDTFVHAGDLVCIDEAWRFWGTDSKILPEHFIFFREHRHYVHPDTKVSCDLTLMTQDISDLHRKVKYVVEMSIRTTKLKSLGFSKTYRVEIWEGYKTTAKLKVKTEVKKYDPAVFPLYSSYEGGNGKELVQDSHQNILNSKKLWFGCLALVVVGYIAVTNIIKFFAPTDTKLQTPKPIAGAPSPSSNSGQNNTGSASTSSPSPFSAEWRVVGSFKGSSGVWVVVQDSKGRSRLESPTVFNEPNSVLAIGTIDGQRVSAFSGASTTKEISK